MLSEQCPAVWAEPSFGLKAQMALLSTMRVCHGPRTRAGGLYGLLRKRAAGGTPEQDAYKRLQPVYFAEQLLNHARLDRPHGCLSSVPNGYFSQQVLDVLFHSLDADFERLGDFLVRQPEGDMREHLAFAGR